MKKKQKEDGSLAAVGGDPRGGVDGPSASPAPPLAPSDSKSSSTERTNSQERFAMAASRALSRETSKDKGGKPGSRKQSLMDATGQSPSSRTTKNISDYGHKLVALCRKGDWVGVDTIIKYIMKYKVEFDANAVAETTGWSPLMFAVKDNRIQIVEQLIDLGFPINTKAKVSLFDWDSEKSGTFCNVPPRLVGGGEIQVNGRGRRTLFLLATQSSEPESLLTWTHFGFIRLALTDWLLSACVMMMVVVVILIILRAYSLYILHYESYGHSQTHSKSDQSGLTLIFHYYRVPDKAIELQ